MDTGTASDLTSPCRGGEPCEFAMGFGPGAGLESRCGAVRSSGPGETHLSILVVGGGRPDVSAALRPAPAGDNPERVGGVPLQVPKRGGVFPAVLEPGRAASYGDHGLMGRPMGQVTRGRGAAVMYPSVLPWRRTSGHAARSAILFSSFEPVNGAFMGTVQCTRQRWRPGCPYSGAPGKKGDDAVSSIRRPLRERRRAPAPPRGAVLKTDWGLSCRMARGSHPAVGGPSVGSLPAR
jgi:hypothetical protein